MQRYQACLLFWNLQYQWVTSIRLTKLILDIHRWHLPIFVKMKFIFRGISISCLALYCKISQKNVILTNALEIIFFEVEYWIRAKAKLGESDRIHICILLIFFRTFSHKNDSNDKIVLNLFRSRMTKKIVHLIRDVSPLID